MWLNDSNGNSFEVLADVVGDELPDDVIFMTVVLVSLNRALSFLESVEDNEAM